MAKKVWRSFEEARKFVHQLRLKNQKDWQAYATTGDRPGDVPSNPCSTYRSEFKDWGDWLGTRSVARWKRRFRPFAEAREYVHRLGLKGQSEWQGYAKTSDRPRDVPSDPARAYRTAFKDWGDWLGTSAVARQNRSYRSYSEARQFVQRLGLKNKRDWLAYVRSGQKPDDIPSNAALVYGPEFKDWGDWLGTRNVRPADRRFLPFAEARGFVRRLGLKNQNDWRAYCKSGRKPMDVPASPTNAYGSEFEGWGDWLGTGRVANQNRTFRPFAEARDFARALGLKNQKAWQAYAQTDERPEDVPVNPDSTYGSEFQGYGDWLGTGTVAPSNHQFRPFIEARDFVRKLGFRSQEDWRAYCKSGQRPQNIPAYPEGVYGSEFRGYGDWIGVINAWRKGALLALLDDLRSKLPLLEERELYVILQQGGSLPALRVALGATSPRQVLKDLKDNEGRGLKQALRGASDDVLDAPAHELLADDGVDEEGELATLVADQVFEHRDTDDPDDPLSGSGDGRALVDAGTLLPTLATRDGLRVVDQLVALSCGLDDDAAEYLVANRVSGLWERYTSEGRAVVEALLAGEGGRWFTEIKDHFLHEAEGVEGLVIPAGWSFTANGAPAPPNAMQRRAAWAVREKRRAGNWSGVGAGKTLSAVLASRVIHARVSLIVTANATVEGWCDQIERAYPHPQSLVHTDVDDGLVLDRAQPNYLVLNYEKFQAAGRDHLVHRLLGLGLDLVVFDEVQLVKQRDRDASLRRKALEALVCGAAQLNPELRVLGMSATPVINNLLEARKLLEIVTGLAFPELDTAATVNNALAMHRALMLHGFRYRPRYEQEMHTEIITTIRNDLLGPLRDAEHGILAVEQLLLPAKLEAASPYFRAGTIVYTHYVDGMVAPIRRYLEAMGLKVGLYSGEDKSGLKPFLAGTVDVLVGTSPVGTGLDGLQAVCDRLVMLSLPWTGAEYEQIIGRIRRQGSAFDRVEIIVPQVTLDHAGDTWSWDRGRMAAIQYKRTLSDCALDGHIPETVRINPNELQRQSRAALDRWIERIGADGILALERQRLTVPLPPDIRHAAQVRLGDFTVLNGRWATARSGTTHERLQHDPAEWYLYHTLYREARAEWPEQPVERIAARIRARPDWVVGDFGCGEALLEHALPNRVIGLDHIAWDEDMVGCDMAATPLDDAALDVAVFSLALMGSNWTDYLREAHRTLKPYGHLFIAEPQRKWQGRTERLTTAVQAAGFEVVGEVEQRFSFLYLTALKV